MKATAITPNNEELPDGWFWARDANGEWVVVNDDTPEFLSFERMGRDMMTGEAWALDPETGEWEQI